MQALQPMRLSEASRDFLERRIKKYDEPDANAVENLKRSIFEFLKKYQYEIHDENEKVVAIMVDFATKYTFARNQRILKEKKDYTGKIDKSKDYMMPKGLLLFGNCGTGKTLLAKLMSIFTGIKFYEASEIALNYLCDGDDWYRDFSRAISKEAIVIDDIGAERDVKRYGNESILIEFLSQRTRLWEEFQIPTIITSNFQERNEIAERYGDRIKSRFLGAFQPVKLSGKDRRMTP